MQFQVVKKYYWIPLIVLVSILDQITKFYASKNLIFGKFYPVIPQVNFYLTHNKGIAFSLFSNSSSLTHNILLVVSCIVILSLTTFAFKLENNQNFLKVALALIIGGAIGNVVDKITLGYVIDFIDFYISTWHFATFNLADAAISIGALMLCIDSLYKKD